MQNAKASFVHFAQNQRFCKKLFLTNDFICDKQRKRQRQSLCPYPLWGNGDPLKLRESEDFMNAEYEKMKNVLNYLCYTATLWNDNPEFRTLYAQRIHTALQLGSCIGEQGIKIEIWSEAPRPKTICYIRIESIYSGEILGRSPNNTKWYNSYKFQRIDYNSMIL